jgi:hypothetical protein
MGTEEIIERAERFAERRAYLYNDAESFLGGVREAVYALMDLLDSGVEGAPFGAAPAR